MANASVANSVRVNNVALTGVAELAGPVPAAPCARTRGCVVNPIAMGKNAAATGAVACVAHASPVNPALAVNAWAARLPNGPAPPRNMAPATGVTAIAVSVTRIATPSHRPHTTAIPMKPVTKTGNAVNRIVMVNNAAMMGVAAVVEPARTDIPVKTGPV